MIDERVEITDKAKPAKAGRSRSVFAGARVRFELKELLQLAWPVILSRLGMMTMGFVDLVVVSHYSTKELGYQALGWGPTAVIMTMGIGLVSGVQVMSARHVGEGRPEATGGVFRRGVVYSLWAGLVCAALLWATGPLFLHAMKFDAELADGASRVLIVLAWSMPFQIVLTAATLFLESLSRPKPATVAMWVCNGVNLALNLLLVPGVLGLPALGAVGAAWATFGSRGVLMVWLLIYIFTMPDARALGLFAKPIDGKDAAREQRKLGYGTAASYFVEVASFNAMNIYGGWLGGLALGAWTVILNIAAIIFMLPLGLSSATAVLVGRAYGEGDRRGVVRAAVLGYGVCTVMLSVVAISVLIGSRWIGRVYTADLDLLAVVGPGLALCSLFYVADGLQNVAANSLRARGDVWLPTVTHTVSYLAIMAPLAWVLAFPLKMGLDGILWAVIVASFAAAGLLLGRFWQLSRRDARQGLHVD